MWLRARLPWLNTLEKEAGRRRSALPPPPSNAGRNSVIWQTTACLLPAPPAFNTQILPGADGRGIVQRAGEEKHLILSHPYQNNASKWAWPRGWVRLSSLGVREVTGAAKPAVKWSTSPGMDVLCLWLYCMDVPGRVACSSGCPHTSPKNWLRTWFVIKHQSGTIWCVCKLLWISFLYCSVPSAEILHFKWISGSYINICMFSEISGRCWCQRCWSKGWTNPSPGCNWKSPKASQVYIHDGDSAPSAPGSVLHQAGCPYPPRATNSSSHGPGPAAQRHCRTGNYSPGKPVLSLNCCL